MYPNYDFYIPKFINNGKEYKFLKNSTGKILNSYFRRRERIINFFDSFVNYAGQMAWIGIIEKYFVYLQFSRNANLNVGGKDDES